MTGPRRIKVVNQAWQLGGDRALLATVAADADVLLLVECRDRDNRPVRVGQLLDSLDHRVGDWWVWQDTSSGSRAGSAVAVRKGSGLAPARRQNVADRTRPARRAVGARAARVSVLQQVSRARRGRTAVQARYLRTVRLVDRSPDLRPGRTRRRSRLTVGAVHLPLASTGQQGAALRALATWWRRTGGRRLVAGDGNMPPREVATALRAAHHGGADVMFGCWSIGLAFDVDRRHHAGSDHFVLTLTERPTR